MLKDRRLVIGHELANAFLYAELHCALLMRLANSGNLPMPDVPPMATEEELLESFIPFIDDISLIELRAALRSASLVFDQLVNRGFLEDGDTRKQLLTAKRRLHRARIWLSRVADNGMVDSLCIHGWSSTDIGISLGRAEADTDRYIS